MTIDWIRRYCLSLPHVTERIQWENDLVFKIAGKMFVVAMLDPGKYCMSLKCAPEEFAELLETPGIAPAPYLARAKWVAFESYAVLPRPEMERLLQRAYDTVVAKLPKKTQAALTKPKPGKAKAGAGTKKRR